MLNLVMNRSVFVLRSDDCSASFMILAAADSEAGFVTLICIAACVFIAPENTSFPSKTAFGTDSPVRAELSTKDFPLITVPSAGIRSPGFTIIVSPHSRSSAFTVLSMPL